MRLKWYINTSIFKFSRRSIIRTRLKISILGIFWLVVLERHKAFLRPPHQNLSQNTRFLGRRILRLSKIVIIEPKTQVILSDQRVFWCGLGRFLYLKIGVRIVLRRLYEHIFNILFPAGYYAYMGIHTVFSLVIDI